ncbi:hypothetical protein ACI65C_000125 [Semiaphis heraclei]
MKIKFKLRRREFTCEAPFRLEIDSDSTKIAQFDNGNSDKSDPNRRTNELSRVISQDNKIPINYKGTPYTKGGNKNRKQLDMKTKNHLLISQEQGLLDNQLGPSEADCRKVIATPMESDPEEILFDILIISGPRLYSLLLAHKAIIGFQMLFVKTFTVEARADTNNHDDNEEEEGVLEVGNRINLLPPLGLLKKIMCALLQTFISMNDIKEITKTEKANHIDLLYITEEIDEGLEKIKKDIEENKELTEKAKRKEKMKYLRLVNPFTLKQKTEEWYFKHSVKISCFYAVRCFSGFQFFPSRHYGILAAVNNGQWHHLSVMKKPQVVLNNVDEHLLLKYMTVVVHPLARTEHYLIGVKNYLVSIWHIFDPGSMIKFINYNVTEIDVVLIASFKWFMENLFIQSQTSETINDQARIASSRNQLGLTSFAELIFSAKFLKSLSSGRSSTKHHLFNYVLTCPSVYHQLRHSNANTAVFPNRWSAGQS